MGAYFLSEVEFGADAGAGADDGAGAEAGVDEVSELPELPLLSPEDFGLALP
jgi:hypothetical protein